MSLVILHSWEVIKFESADQYQAHACLGLLENKPQIKAPRVTSLQSRASGGRIHVCPRRAYVGTKSRSVAFGVGVSTYALRGIGVRGVENPQGFGIDERRFANMASSFIRTLKPVFAPSAYFGVRLKHAPQRARRTQRGEQ